MSKRPESAGLMVHLLFAVAVLGLVFGGGVVVGWATRERRPPAMETIAAPIPDAEVKRELAACRRAVKARAKATAIPPATATSPQGETDDAGVEKAAAKVEALQKEVKECRVRETLANAYVCGAIGDHLNLLFVLTYSASCTDEGGVGELMVNSFNKCAEFTDLPEHLNEDHLTQEEKIRIYEAKLNRAVRTRNSLIGDVQEMHRRCRKRFGLPDE
ncbi:hypothetical protein WME90_02715 [Sorangium sp. So ce375]|jgi:hypothetical protein|uniref:hypothetical protein n=1 Tax=Sorangium sp. So ce375 TaxID=3133306 RepID=UPI003F5B131D